MIKIKGVDYDNGEITSIYVEDISGIKKFNINKKQFGINIKRKSSLAPSI